jgi:hypothetical protein
MITQHSGIRRLFTAEKTVEERADASQARFVTRLGDIKVETKTGNDIGDVDGPFVTDRYL